MSDALMADASSGERASNSPGPSNARHTSVPTRGSSRALSSLGGPLDPVSKEDTPIVLSAFERVTQDLIKIGAIPLKKFATEDYPVEDTSALVKPSAVVSAEMLGGVKANFQAVAQIYEACMKHFGNSEGISWDHMSELGPNCKECILTITRPNNAIRAYTSGPYFKSKNDAKVAAASVAIDMRVLEFIQYGETDVHRSRQIDLSLAASEPRLKAESSKEAISITDDVETKIDDPNVQAIENCIREWRAGTVKPMYIHFSEPTVVTRAKGKGKKSQPITEMELSTLRQGCALKIEITQHAVRVFSVHHIHQTRAEAKAAVAALALKQGVIDFIKYANGQTEPMVWIPELHGDANENLNKDIIVSHLGQPKMEVEIDATAVSTTLKRYQVPLDVMTLQAFTNALPKPLPETPGLRAVGESNPVGWINTAVQLARGSRMGVTWTYLSNAKTSLHGCLLRFSLPQDSDGRSYVVEPVFSKRGDAKSAVAYLAISQGVGAWIKSIKDKIDNLMTPELVLKAQALLPMLNSECTRVGIKGQPSYIYEFEDGAVGCMMKVEFSPELSRTWVVPMQYKTKPDARSAAVLQAQEDGVLEFIRFKGENPPEDYDAGKPFDHKASTKKSVEPRVKNEGEKQNKQPKPTAERRDNERHKRFKSQSDNNKRQTQAQGKWHRDTDDRDILEQNDQVESMDWQDDPSSNHVQPPLPMPVPPAYPPYPVPGFENYPPPPVPQTSYPYAPPQPPAFFPPASVPGYPYPPIQMLPAPTLVGYPPIGAGYPPVPQQYYLPQPTYESPNELNSDWSNRPPPNAPTGPRKRDEEDRRGYDESNRESTLDPAVRALRPPVISRKDHKEDWRGRRRPRSRSRPVSPTGERPRSRSRSRSPERTRKYRSRADSRSRSFSRERQRKLKRHSRSKSPSPRRSNIEIDPDRPTFDPPKPNTTAVDSKANSKPATISNALNSETKNISNTGTGTNAKPAPLSTKAGAAKPSGFKYTIALDAHCAKNNMKRPIYKHEEVKPGEYKVWIVLDRERLELPITFKDIDVGKEKIAKQVLARAKGITIKPKNKSTPANKQKPAEIEEEDLEPGEVRD